MHSFSKCHSIISLNIYAILKYILPQFNILSNSSENAAERVTIELLRTSLNNPQLIEMARDYVTLRFNSSTIFDSVHKKISLLVDKICDLLPLNFKTEGTEKAIGQSFNTDLNFVKIFLVSLQQKLKKQSTTNNFDFVCNCIKEVDSDTFFKVANTFE